ncbi:hypothetical protein Bca52824_029667 [Brassica carinata]|uniref:Uncharacterized protein n=1 Tax=Brassica carinata TaxID=52824 RepID=A0A8X7S7J7_BRACI|nr:hypothetical protein Bca52824_029667 [Brassica carinata]
MNLAKNKTVSSHTNLRRGVGDYTEGRTTVSANRVQLDCTAPLISIGLMVSHGAIQFTAYKELPKVIVDFNEKRRNSESTADHLLNSADYAALGGSSKVVALLEHDYSKDLVPTESQDRYIDSLHVIRETARFEGLRGFYRGLTANLLKNVPASSITFIVYETVLKHPPTR